MKLVELYSTDRPIFSLEFFPPKREEDMEATFDLILRLKEVEPDFMTVTYGAGGGTRSRTRTITSFILNALQVPAMAHLTCVGHSVEEIDSILDEFSRSGIQNILALRGDPPKGTSQFEPHPGGFCCARDLVQHIRQRGDFGVVVAGYPETHLDAKSPEADIAYLKEKIDAGGELVITQLFFDSKFYFDFVERARQADIHVPIVPGIMPIANVGQVERFTKMCGATIPETVRETLHKLKSDSQAVKDFGTEYAIQVCQELLEQGAPGIHFYTLNKSRQVEAVLKAIQPN